MGDVLEDTISPYWDEDFAVEDYPHDLSESAVSKKQALDDKWNRGVVAVLREELPVAEQREAAARPARRQG
ncbi:MAG: hypothetical protein IH895_08830, partial [Planctomycetes bacterium]|nr:hypothetical protein [Planctomycetota bacterium]